MITPTLPDLIAPTLPDMIALTLPDAKAIANLLPEGQLAHQLANLIAVAGHAGTPDLIYIDAAQARELIPLVQDERLLALFAGAKA